VIRTILKTIFLVLVFIFAICSITIAQETGHIPVYGNIFFNEETCKEFIHLRHIGHTEFIRRMENAGRLLRLDQQVNITIIEKKIMTNHLNIIRMNITMSQV
jgi:hypothetical protein